MNSNPYAGYKVALVMSHAGLNVNQLAVFRKRLQEIARLGGAEPAGLLLTVPVVHNKANEQAALRTEELLTPLRRVTWLNIEVLTVGPVEALLLCLRDYDEVWCATTNGQGERCLRPSKVHRLAQRLREAPKFKLLHYWVEEEPEKVTGKSKQRVMKG